MRDPGSDAERGPWPPSGAWPPRRCGPGGSRRWRTRPRSGSGRRPAGGRRRAAADPAPDRVTGGVTGRAPDSRPGRCRSRLRAWCRRAGDLGAGRCRLVPSAALGAAGVAAGARGTAGRRSAVGVCVPSRPKAPAATPPAPSTATTAAAIAARGSHRLRSERTVAPSSWGSVSRAVPASPRSTTSSARASRSRRAATSGGSCAASGAEPEPRSASRSRTRASSSGRELLAHACSPPRGPVGARSRCGLVVGAAGRSLTARVAGEGTWCGGSPGWDAPWAPPVPPPAPSRAPPGPPALASAGASSRRSASSTGEAGAAAGAPALHGPGGHLEDRGGLLHGIALQVHQDQRRLLVRWQLSSAASTRRRRSVEHDLLAGSTRDRHRRARRRARRAPRGRRAAASAARTFARRSRSRQALTTIRCSQVVTAASPRKESARRNAEIIASWSASAASSGWPVVRRATAHSRSRCRAKSSPKAVGVTGAVGLRAACGRRARRPGRGPPRGRGRRRSQAARGHDLTEMSADLAAEARRTRQGAWSARPAGSASSGPGPASPWHVAGALGLRPDLVELVEAAGAVGDAGGGGVHLEGGGLCP